MATAAASPSPLQKLLRRPIVMLALALLTIALVMSLIGQFTKPREATVKPLSTEAGTEMFAALSPDGKQVAYSGRASSGEDSFHIFVRPIPTGAARQLTQGSGSDVAPAWSPDGAKLVFGRMEEGRVQYLVMPAAGGAAQTIASFDGFSEAQSLPAAAWSRDGAQIAIVGRLGSAPATIMLVPASGGTPKPLTAPAEGAEGDTAPAFSPDGRSLAFVRRAANESADIWISDLAGGPPRRVTYDDHQIRGIAWNTAGDELIFSSNRARGFRLWHIPAAGGGAREVSLRSKEAQYPTVAGDRLVYSQSPNVSAIWRAEVKNPASERSIIRSAGREQAPSYSPDGAHIAYLSDQSGADEIWIADADGGNPRQVSRFNGPRPSRPRWSPDGKTLLFELPREGRWEIDTIPAGGGTVAVLMRGAGGSPSWSRDGRWIYYGRRQIFRMKPDGSGDEQLTKRGGSSPVESVDGKWIYYHRAREIWRIPAAGGEEESVYQPSRNLIWGSIVPVKKGLYFMQWDFGPRTAQLVFFDLESRQEENVFNLHRSEFDRGASFDLSPDGTYIIYPRMDQTETNLMLAEGFR